MPANVLKESRFFNLLDPVIVCFLLYHMIRCYFGFIKNNQSKDIVPTIAIPIVGVFRCCTNTYPQDKKGQLFFCHNWQKNRKTDSWGSILPNCQTSESNRWNVVYEFQQGIHWKGTQEQPKVNPINKQNQNVAFRVLEFLQIMVFQVRFIAVRGTSTRSVGESL